MNVYIPLKSLFHMLRLPMPEAEAYCREQRYKRFETYGPQVHFIRLHGLVHHALVGLLKLQRIVNGQKLIVLSDRRKRTDRPLIFCPTHIGGSDIEIAFQAIESPCWLAMGDPRECYKNFAGMMLQMNGIIPFDTCHKQDRHIAKAQMAELLRKGGNLLLFPEGTWNISPNKLTLHLYAGAVELAITTGADIVPIALYRQDKTYYANIGANLRFDSASIHHKFQLTDVLRDAMATLVWDTLTHFSPTSRADLPDDYYDVVFMQEIDALLKAEPNTFTLQDIKDDIRYRPPSQNPSSSQSIQKARQNSRAALTPLTAAEGRAHPEHSSKPLAIPPGHLRQPLI